MSGETPATDAQSSIQCESLDNAERRAEYNAHEKRSAKRYAQKQTCADREFQPRKHHGYPHPQSRADRFVGVDGGQKIVGLVDLGQTGP